MALRPHKKLVVPFEKNEKQLISRVLAEESPSQYIKSLIRLDIESPELLRFEHENWKTMSKDARPYKLTMRIYCDTDADILDRFKEVGSPYSYIKDLICWDMGLNPELARNGHTRKKRAGRGEIVNPFLNTIQLSSEASN